MISVFWSNSWSSQFLSEPLHPRPTFHHVLEVGDSPNHNEARVKWYLQCNYSLTHEVVSRLYWIWTSASCFSSNFETLDVTEWVSEWVSESSQHHRWESASWQSVQQAAVMAMLGPLMCLVRCARRQPRAPGMDCKDRTHPLAPHATSTHSISIHTFILGLTCKTFWSWKKETKN